MTTLNGCKGDYIKYCQGKPLSMPESVGITSLEGKTSKLKIDLDNINLRLCDLRDYFARPLLMVQTDLIQP